MAIRILSSENITGSFEVSGKVGIGTAPTSRNLSVFRGTAGSVANFLHYTDASNFAGLYIGVSQSSQTVSLNASGSSGGNFEMQCGNAPVLSINNLSATFTGFATFTGKVDSINGEGFRLKNAANTANEAGFVRSGYWEGNTNRDPGIFAETGLNLRFYTGGSGTPKMILSSTGNVGIGTGTNIYGDLHLQGGQQDIILTNTAADGVAGLTISRIIGQARGYSNNGAVMQSIDFITNSGAWYKGDIVFKTNNTDGTDTTVAATERMRIKADGSINIGERRAALPSNFGYSSSYKTLILGSSGTNYTTDAVTLSLGVDVSGNPSGSYNGSGREIIIRNEGSFISPNASNNGYNTILSWNSSGQPYFNQNVGIGTTNPVVRLDFGNATGKAFHLYTSAADYYGFNMLQYDSGPFSTNIFSGNGGEIKLRTASGTNTQSTRLTVKAAGNVGIGLTNPSEKLDVNGRVKWVTATGGDIYLFAGSKYYLDGGSNTYIVGESPDGDNIGFVTGGSTAMTIDENQSVGIGVTSPASKLDISGGRIGIRNNIVAASNLTYSTIYSTENTGAAYPFTGTSGNLVVEPRNGQDFVVLGTSGVAKMVVKGGGNVGIGTPSPAGLLTIKGTGDAIRVESTNTGAGGAQIDLLHFTTSPADGDTFGMINMGGYYTGTTSVYGTSIKSIWTDVSARNADLTFSTNNSGTLTQRMRITSGGVIATTNAQGAFSGAASLIVTQNGTLPYQIWNYSGTSTSFRLEMDQYVTSGNVRQYFKQTNAGVSHGFSMTFNSGSVVFGDLEVASATTNSGSAFKKDSKSRMTLCQASNSTALTDLQEYFNPNGAVGKIQTNGSATLFTTSSDYRLKEDLKSFSGLEMVNKIPVYDFKWKISDERSYGVIAHELQEILPQAVGGDKDYEKDYVTEEAEYDDDHNLIKEPKYGKRPSYQTVDYSKIVPLLVKSIQELKAEIELLKNK